jgi:hypothetical protein
MAHPLSSVRSHPPAVGIVGMAPTPVFHVVAIPFFVLAALLLRSATNPAIPYLGRGGAGLLSPAPA